MWGQLLDAMISPMSELSPSWAVVSWTVVRSLVMTVKRTWLCEMILAKRLTGRTDRVGRRPQILVGLAIGAAVAWIFPTLESFPLLLAVAAVYGGAVATVRSASAALITDLARRERYGSAHGVFGTLMDIGHASGPITAGIIIANAGYRPAFLTCSAVLMTAGILFITMVDSQAVNAATHDTGGTE